MPFKSEAQRRKFQSDPKLRKYIPEFEADTPAKLPERLTPKKKKKTKAKKTNTAGKR